MTDNKARAREVAMRILGLSTLGKGALATIKVALDAAERRGEARGLKEAATIAGTMAERPYDNEPEFSAVLAVEAAIAARVEQKPAK